MILSEIWNNNILYFWYLFTHKKTTEIIENYLNKYMKRNYLYIH